MRIWLIIVSVVLTIGLTAGSALLTKKQHDIQKDRDFHQSYDVTYGFPLTLMRDNREIFFEIVEPKNPGPLDELSARREDTHSLKVDWIGFVVDLALYGILSYSALLLIWALIGNRKQKNITEKVDNDGKHS